MSKSWKRSNAIFFGKNARPLCEHGDEVPPEEVQREGREATRRGRRLRPSDFRRLDTGSGPVDLVTAMNRRDR